MAFVVRIRRIDIRTGDDNLVVLLRGRDAEAFGISPGDRLQINYGGKKLVVMADITHESIRHGEIGLFEEVWKAIRASEGEPLNIELISRPPSVAAIKKKLLGQRLNEAEIFSVIRDIVDRRLTPIETTYFVASGYVKPYSLDELIWMVKAMARTGETFDWNRRRVVDKHSVGGLAGNRTTMVVIPIIAALGLTIPKTSSRAITSPSGTADTMEVLAPVSFSGNQVRRLVARTGACLIWGGGLSIAPADDLIIRVSRPLSLEPYDKMIVSIMAKKVAMGVKYLIIDMPFGPDTKIPNIAVARLLESKFRAVAQAFSIKIKVLLDPADEPIGKGIGPALEARDVLRVLQQKEKRPRDLEDKAVGLAAELLELAGRCRPGQGRGLATTALVSGRAWRTMQAIIRVQGGDPDVDANQLMTGAFTYRYNARRSGRVKKINNRAIDEIARTLGAPDHKLAGIYLHRKTNQYIGRGEKLLTLYSYSQDRLHLAVQAIALPRLVTIG